MRSVCIQLAAHNSFNKANCMQLMHRVTTRLDVAVTCCCDEVLQLSAGTEGCHVVHVIQRG